MALLALTMAVLVQAQQSAMNGAGAMTAAGPAGVASAVGTTRSTRAAAGATGAHDPGVRAGGIGVGKPIATLSSVQLRVFLEGEAQFKLAYSVSGTAQNAPGAGLGPAFNSNSCSSCHAQATEGGTSPSEGQFPSIGPNPQVAIAHELGATNALPSFITADGPVFAVRFPMLINADGMMTPTIDGDVHELFTIAGRSDAPNCRMSQADFDQVKRFNDAIFRIPTPVFGAGLIENISDATILANKNAKAEFKKGLGISGRPNGGGDDQWQQTSGTIARFGWKAQHNSLEVFSGEAYSLEMGVTNNMFAKERGNPPAGCYFGRGAAQGGTANGNGNGQPLDLVSDMMAVADFMRFLAPPARSAIGIPGNPSQESVLSGQKLFSKVHCDACHTPALQTGESAYTSALSHQQAQLFSDLLLHHMGTGLADRVTQGTAGPDEFRTAPLWGAGQRIFFLHDGRATPANGGLLTAIKAHASPGSEANRVISLFNALNERQKQDLLNFLRSL
jgi:CxxC motif-containing protein (DUF1111 family)